MNCYPFVSVVMTAYNYGRFIEESIDSVLSQDYPAGRLELIVVDDGSTDDTPERIKKYGHRIIYLRQPNGGQASALNLGFAHTTGEIVSLLDADDYFLPGKLARVAEAFANDPNLGMFYHPFLQFDNDTKERSQSRFALVSGSIFQEPHKFLWYAGPGTCVSFRRLFLDQLLPIPEEIRMLADGYLGSLIIFLAPILSTPDCLAAYRFHGNNSYREDESRMPPDVRRKRLNLYEIEFRAMQKWLAAHGFTREQPPVRCMLDRWNITLETERFILHPPGRVPFFRHLLARNRFFGPTMTPRLRAINWFNAFASLFTGYKHFGLLDRWRLAATKTAKTALGLSPAAKP